MKSNVQTLQTDALLCCNMINAEVEKNKTQGDADCNVALDLLCFTGRKGEQMGDSFPPSPVSGAFLKAKALQIRRPLL